MKILIALAVAMSAFAQQSPAFAQQSIVPLSHQSEIGKAALIYGYNLAEGNWTHSQATCAAMPQIIMFHFVREFHNGTESLFTALVPRVAGRVRIVPVLYHGATPFVPAPKNPRNYALFNGLIAAPGSTSGGNGEKRFLELGTCYAEMTGDVFHPRPKPNVGIAGQPAPTVRLNPRDKTANVLIAERDSDHSYRLWSIAFKRGDRVASAGAEETSVYAARVASSRAASSPPASAQAAPAPSTTQTPVETQQSGSREAESARLQHADITAPVASQSAPAGQTATATQPGWRLILNPPQPPSKFLPDAPPPLEKSIPEPSNGPH